MENRKTILLHNITPNELKEMILSGLKKEIESILLKTNKSENQSIQKAAELLGLSEQTIYNYIKKGMLPATKIGRKYIIRRTSLEKSLTEVKSLKYRR